MGIQDIKSNVNAIKNSHLIPFVRKQSLLLTQLQTIDFLFLNTAELVSSKEKQEAKFLANEIQSYLESFSSEIVV